MSKIKNRPKSAWLEARPFRLGTYVQTADPATVEVLAEAGFDYVVIDGEHSPLSMETIKNLITAAQIRGMAPLVRVKENRPALVMEPLDIGAAGVQIPQIETPAEAVAAVRATKYHPLGERGSNPYVRAADYASGDYGEYMARANDDTLVVLQVEGARGLENIESIMDTPGIDVIWVGPYDLSQSLGVPGQIYHPDILAGLKRIVGLAESRGVRVGAFAPDVAGGRRWLESGVKFLAVSYETRLLYEQATRVVSELNS